MKLKTTMIIILISAITRTRSRSIQMDDEDQIENINTIHLRGSQSVLRKDNRKIFRRQKWEEAIAGQNSLEMFNIGSSSFSLGGALSIP